MKKTLLLVIICFTLIAFAGCARPQMPDADNSVKAVFFDHVYDADEIQADAEAAEDILKLYSESRRFTRNRSLAGIVPPKPVEIRIDWENGQSTQIYLNGAGKIGVRDADGTYWLVKNEELLEYLESLQSTCENPE